MFMMRSASPVSFLLVAFSAYAQAAVPSSSEQFDLICAIRGHVAADPHPRFRGNYPANERVWSGWHHFTVDLQTRQFCLPLWCEAEGPRPIASVDARQIIFLDRPRPTARENFEYMVVRRSDGRFRFRTGDDEGYVRVETGRCRRARFSSFPATAHH
jgi:hypothetical protein